MSKRSPSRPSHSPEEVCTVRIELLGTDPVIWRQLEVPTSITLKRLHDIVQIAMGWWDNHLWEFTIGKQRYGLPMDEDWGTEPRTNAQNVRLSHVLHPRRTTMDYLYDFGDCWEHRITVTDARIGEAGVEYPRYVAGERNSPPEDSGGVWAFSEKLEAMADPTHPDHDEIKDWMAGYDPNRIDEESLGIGLGRFARRRNAGRAGAAQARAGREWVFVGSKKAARKAKPA